MEAFFTPLSITPYIRCINKIPFVSAFIIYPKSLQHSLLSHATNLAQAIIIFFFLIIATNRSLWFFHYFSCKLFLRQPECFFKYTINWISFLCYLSIAFQPRVLRSDICCLLSHLQEYLYNWISLFVWHFTKMAVTPAPLMIFLSSFSDIFSHCIHHYW